MHTWENRLYQLAYRALEQHHSLEPIQMHQRSLLEPAYAYCEQLTHLHSRTFYLASSLLPPENRRAVRALYAFCRVTDDLVDRAHGDVETSLTSWKKRSLASYPEEDDLVSLAWTDTRQAYNIPHLFAEQLINGVAMDLNKVRYKTFDDLTVYCYGVACTVGLMAMHIIGYRSQEAIPYAIRLGVALQLTNILRDVGEDWRAGRVYLPQQELDAFGLNEGDLATGLNHHRWREFMRFQIERNREIYAKAMPGIRLLKREGRFAIAAAAELYRSILNKIEEQNYDIFYRRAAVSTWGKLRQLPGIWWRSRSGDIRPSKKVTPVHQMLNNIGLTHFEEKGLGIGVLDERTLVQHPNSQPSPGELRNSYNTLFNGEDEL
jgi:15-cis-phytoene synthase